MKTVGVTAISTKPNYREKCLEPGDLKQRLWYRGRVFVCKQALLFLNEVEYFKMATSSIYERKCQIIVITKRNPQ